jgi:hypothetical protein
VTSSHNARKLIDRHDAIVRQRELIEVLSHFAKPARIRVFVAF